MNILHKIIAGKKLEVAQRKASTPIAKLEEEAHFRRICISLKKSLATSSTGIIAEFKRKSPSKGWLMQEIAVQDVVTAYEANGAAGISVLTDENYFGGSSADLMAARESINLPILRKDFVVDDYQLYEAKAWGADVILLIAACLSKEQTAALANKAKQLGMEVLLEVHTEAELEWDNEAVDLIGINNRNLDTLEISVQTSFDLLAKLPTGKPAISESGIANAATVLSLKRAGFSGFLIGETFMKAPVPAIAFAEFTQALNALE